MTNGQPGKGFAITSMVCSIVATTLAWHPILSFFTIPLVVVSLVFGVIAIKTKRPGRWLAKAGLITSGVSIMMAVFIPVGWFWLLSNINAFN